MKAASLRHPALLAAFTALTACTGLIGDATDNSNRNSDNPRDEPVIDYGSYYTPDSRGTDDGKLTRISVDQYQNSITDVLGLTLDLTPFIAPDEKITTGFQVGFDVGPSAVADYMDAADAIASRLIDNGAPAGADCLKNGATDSCINTMKPIITRLWRRDLSTVDVDDIKEVFAGESDKLLGAYAVWIFVLAHPSFLYVVQEPTNDGKATPFELAARMALTLWRSAPDEELMNAARSGALTDTDELAAQADRLMDDARFTKTATRFLNDWTHLKELNAQTLGDRFPDWSGDVAAAYTKSLNDLFAKATTGNMMDVLFRSSKYWANDTMLAMLNETTRGSEGAYEFGNTRKGGILTHPAFLASTNRDDGGDIIHRGVFVRRDVLCESGVVAPPDVAMALPKVDNPKTNRDLYDPLLVTQPCATCHALFQPAGNAFEHFDGSGAYRDEDNGEEIEMAGSIPLVLAGGELAFDSDLDLAEKLAASEQTSACLTRNFMRYALSEPLTTNAVRASLKTTHEAFEAGGATFASLVRAFVTSDAFRSQTTPPVE